MEWFSLAVDAITALAIVFAAWQLLFHSRQMHRELENLYVQRYWELMDQRSESFTVEGDPKPSDRRVIHAYLQLCEDEIDLRRLGRVTDNTWKFWCEAIRSQATSPSYASFLSTAPADRWPLLRELTAQPAAYDPLRDQRNWMWRKLHGL